MGQGLAQVTFIKNKPYFFHRVVYNYESIHTEHQKYPKTRYYYTKIYDNKTKRTGYAIYLDRKVIY